MKIDLTVSKGNALLVISCASGSGKSTLQFRCVQFHSEIPVPAKLILQGDLIGKRNRAKTMKRISYSNWPKTACACGYGVSAFQICFPYMTVKQNVMEGPRTVRNVKKIEIRRRKCERRADRYLEKVGLGWRRVLIASHLSGGQQQRVAIARALAWTGTSHAV